jgi:glycine oxidase
VSGFNSGYARLGRLQPIDDEKALLLARNRLESSKELWRGLAKWRIIESSGPWSLTSRTGKWVFDTLSARINPTDACFSLARAIQKKGGVFEPHLKKYSNIRTVWATGVHDLERISKFTNVKFRTAVKGQAALFNLNRVDYPQVYANSIHFVPHSNGTFAVGSTSENEFSSSNTTDEQLERLIENSMSIIPELRRLEPIKRWADVRPRSESRAPIVGKHPMIEGDYIVNGGFKIGLGMAPELARVLISLIFDGIDQVPEAFKPKVKFRNSTSS